MLLFVSSVTLFFSLGQMLVPATAEDLKSAGKITVSPNFNNANNGNSVKAVQIKVILFYFFFIWWGGT
jgi:hypothetical protein